MKRKKLDDSVTSNQIWNKTNDKFTGYSGMETQRRCDEAKLKFQLNYNCNITKMMNNKEINCFMSDDEIYNKVKLHMTIIRFGSFLPKNANIDILSFVINTPIIDNLNNEKKIQRLDNLDMLRFNDGIYFSDSITRCFLLWMKYQSAKIEFLNSQCFHSEESIKFT